MSKADPRSAGLAAVLLLACAGPAAAQDEGASVSLSCRGVARGVVAHDAARLSSSLDEFRTAERAGTSTLRTQQVPGRMTVLVRDGAVKVRPSPSLRPGELQGRRSADGWYPLSDVVVSDDRITGVAPYGDQFSARFRLVVDRRSGDVRFGSFQGD